MEIMINKEELIEALQIANLAVGSNAKLPVLNNILFEINEGNLTTTSTDLEVFIKHSITINSDVKTRFTAPAKKLKDIIGSLNDAEINLGLNEKKKVLDIKGDNARFSLNTISADDFPKVEVAKKEKTIVIQQAILKELLARTIFAVSKDDKRYAITGICFEIKDNKLTLAGTDGKRLAIASHDLALDTEGLRFILPAKALRNILQLLQKEGDVTIYLDKSLAYFEIGNTLLGIRLIEGEYPDYQKIIPNETKIEFNIDVERLISATKRASIITKDGSGVRYSFKKEKLAITACASEIGDVRDEFEIEGSEEIEIVFYAQYILDALQNINSEKLMLVLNSSTSPAIIEPLNDGNYIQLIMPMQA